MKPKQLFILSALGLAICCSAPVASAQDSGAPFAKPASGGSPSKSERIKEILVGPGDLRKAVSQLEQFLPKTQEPLNVIWGPDMKSQPVPQLELRNVTGPDALMLIAAAANVQVQPIRGLEGDVIGFQFSERPESSLRGGGTEQLTSIETQIAVPPSQSRDADGSRAGSTGGGAKPLPGAPVQPGHVRSYGSVGFVGSGRGFPDGSGSGGVGPRDVTPDPHGFHQGNPFSVGNSDVRKPADDSAISTRVYPLAEITTFVKFDEVEATLRDVLKTENISADAAKLAFHQKTAVLVARAPGAVHKLVQDLLQALAQNNREAREMNATRQLTSMRIELEAMAREKARLENRLAEAETQSRRYMEEARRLPGTIPDKK